MVAVQRRPSSQLSSETNTNGKEAKNPQKCQRCVNHRYDQIRKGHTCPYRSQHHLKLCKCGCDLIELRRNLCNIIRRLKLKNAIVDVEGTEEEAPESPTCRNQCCTNCSAHGISQPLRGHKKDCRYQSCDCEICYYANWLKNVMAQQVALRRKQQKVPTEKQNEENSVQLHLASNDGILPLLCKPIPTRPVVNMETESYRQSSLIQSNRLGQTSTAGFNLIMFPTTSNLLTLPPPPVKVYYLHHPQPLLPSNFNSYSQDSQQLYSYQIYQHGPHPSN